MTVKEYINKMDGGVCHLTFIKARARKDAHTPFYHPEYQTTPLFSTDEVTKKEILSEYIVLNDRMQSITWLCGADWNNWIDKGFARCLLVISLEDFNLLYRGKQKKSMVECIDKKLKP